MVNFNYDLILSDPNYIWSFSRLSKYDDCKYAWMLKYLDDEPESEMFFSEFGSFIHELYADVFSGKIKPNEMRFEFLSGLHNKLGVDMCRHKVFDSYFKGALNAVSNIEHLFNDITNNFDIVGVEKEINFEFAKHKFTGFIDLLLESKDGDLVIIDHKSRNLKPYSVRAKHTKNDQLLDEYFKQLYVYSCAIYQIYGKYPSELWLNCYRNETNNLIKTQFHPEILEQTERWAEETINKIMSTEKWTPNCDPFYCANLCGCHNSCEYYEMMKEK